MIDPSSYRISIIGISHEIASRKMRLNQIRHYLLGHKSSIGKYRCPLSAYQHGIAAMKEIERLEAIKADMQMQLEVYYHLKKIKAA